MQSYLLGNVFEKSCAADDYRPYQKAMTEGCWGFGQGAINNGVVRDEIRAIVQDIVICCGAPQDT